MFLVIGLGNPGPRYEGTRHNVGAQALEALCDEAGCRLAPEKKTNSLTASLRAGVHQVILARTRQPMNLSGQSVRALAQFYKVPPKNLVVLYDDLELPFGEVRARFGGGDHGHRGLKSITQHMGTKEYHKIGIGIGRPPGRMEVQAFVLRGWAASEREHVPVMCADAADEVKALLRAVT